MDKKVILFSNLRHITICLTDLESEIEPYECTLFPALYHNNINTQTHVIDYHNKQKAAYDHLSLSIT